MFWRKPSSLKGLKAKTVVSCIRSRLRQVGITSSNCPPRHSRSRRKATAVGRRRLSGGACRAIRASLRILGKTSAGDTVQVPFVTKATVEAPPVRSLPQTNVGTVGEATRFTVELPDRPLIDRLYLLLGNTNFEGRILLEAADTPGDWQTLLKSARILDISQGAADYRYTSVRFASVRFRYYRLTISGIDRLQIEDVQAAEVNRSEMLRRRYPATVNVLPRVASTKQTQVLIELPEASLVDRVTVYASADVPFDRPVEVSAVADTVFGGDGRLRYRTVASGGSVLTPGLIEPTTFADAVTQRLVATIYDGDDQPLRIDSVVVEGPRRFVTARFDAGESFWLAYGCVGLRLAGLRPGAADGVDPGAIGYSPGGEGRGGSHRWRRWGWMAAR